jgi:hypothetical protein
MLKYVTITAMTANIEEKFYKDLIWTLNELKQEGLANAYSDNQIRFFLTHVSDEEPSFKSKDRILKMLSDLKAISISAFYHQLSILDAALSMQGAQPIGYYVQIIQPRFDEISADIINKKKLPETETEKQKLPAGSNNIKYFITLQSRMVLLNNTFILSKPHFNSENDNFIGYVLENTEKTISKKQFEEIPKIKLKKSFYQILNDLGFRGEIRKVFFDASKSAIKFRNHVSDSDLEKLGVNTKKLAEELSNLESFNKKEKDVSRNNKK